MLQNTNISYQPSENLLCQKIGEEAVLLDMESSRYFGLTPVATRVWEMVSAGQPVAAAAEAIALEYGESQAKVLEDVAQFVETVSERGLLIPRA
jgi:hypothetical protein